MKTKMSEHINKIGAQNEEKVWEQFPDTCWETLVLRFWKNNFFQIGDFPTPRNRPNLGSRNGVR